MEEKLFAHFLEVEPLPLSTFEQFEIEDLKYYYFQIDRNYFLFVYGQNQKYQTVDAFCQTIRIIQLLNKKKRKIRSLRGYLLYVLEFLDKSAEIKTNFKPLFWFTVRDIIRQNRKNILDEFLKSSLSRRER